MEKIKFTPDTGEAIELFIVEQTMINGINYLLVCDEEEGDADALILKEKSTGDSDDAIYTVVEDDMELNAIAQVFEEMMDDVELEK